MERYCCVATSFRAWAQQVAVSYIQRGYHRCVEFWIPKHKDPGPVDRKLISKYNIDISDSARSWRKRNGFARFQYIRHGRFGLLMIADPDGDQEGELLVVMTSEKMTKVIDEYGADLYSSKLIVVPGGQVMIDFAQEEGIQMKHLYHHTICYGGYEIRYRNGHASVRIDERYYGALLARFMDLAKRRDPKHIKEAFRELRFQPFAPLKCQLWRLLDEVNKFRKKERLGAVPYSVVAPALRRVSGPLVVSPEREETEAFRGDKRDWDARKRNAA